MAEMALNDFVKETDSNGYWRVARSFKRHMRSILLFAYKKLEGISIHCNDGWLMGEISKRMKNRDEWSARGVKNLLNLPLKRYAEKARYELFIAKLVESLLIEVKF